MPSATATQRLFNFGRPTLVVVLSWQGTHVLAEWSGWGDGGPNARQHFPSWTWVLDSDLFERDDVRVKVRA